VFESPRSNGEASCALAGAAWSRIDEAAAFQNRRLNPVLRSKLFSHPEHALRTSHEDNRAQEHVQMATGAGGDLVLKVIVVGDNATGKTSIIKRCASAVVSLRNVTACLRRREPLVCCAQTRVADAGRSRMLSAKLISRRLVLTSTSVGTTSTVSRSHSSCGTLRVRCVNGPAYRLTGCGCATPNNSRPPHSRAIFCRPGPVWRHVQVSEVADLLREPRRRSRGVDTCVSYPSTG
jgi:hypothetical protein